MVAPLLVNIFWTAKGGNDADEWEDSVSTMTPGPRLDGSVADTVRLAVADGATDAYDSARWAALLTESFAPGRIDDARSPARIHPTDLLEWYDQMQVRWSDGAPRSFASVFDRAKFHEAGSFATLLGCQIDDSDGRRPRWTAFALGDAVLFHVSGGELATWFPAMRSDEFGTTPQGAHTHPDSLERMVAATAIESGLLAPDDVLILATDALAAWLVLACEQGKAVGWLRRLCAIATPAEFDAFVAGQRECGAMVNDDVTLLRVRLVEPEYLAVCL